IDGTSGKVTGTPTGLTWNGDDTEQTVNIPVVITKGNEKINETIPVVVQRDLDKGEKPLDAGKVNPTNPAVEGQPYTSTEKVINPNKDHATFTATPTNGLTVGTDGKVTGKPTGIEWTGDETSKTVNIPVTVSRTGDTPVTVTIPVVVQRDLDGDGKPDVSDDDIDGDGIPNEKDTTPRQVTPLDAGKVNPTNPAVEGQPYTSNEKVINPNKDDATFTATPTNGLTVGTDGKVTGKPTGITWTGDETSKTVNIPVTVSRTGDTPVTVTIPVVVQRDLDGDGKPDVSDDDIDGDGIPNDQDPAPRVKDGLTSGKVTPTNKAVDGQPYTSKEKVINPNKDDATFTATPTNGLTVGTDGKVTGKPTGITWTGDETSKTVNIPVTVTRTGDTPVTVTIPVVVQRDLDGDGKPDVSDDDIDGDGIPNDQDPAPRVKDGLTAGKVNPTNPAVEGQPYTSTEKVINPNKPGTTVTPTPTNGLTIDGTSGKVTGTPTGITWTGDETSTTVNIPVTVSRTGDTPVTVTIPVVVQRDLDGDGTPDVSDDDIDGDGIPNDQDPAPRVKDGLTAGKVTPTNPAVEGQPYTSTEKVINPNKPGTTVTPTPTNGLTIDGTSGKVTGTPTGLTWNGDDTEQTVNIPVVITKGNEKINETIPVVVQRDLDKGEKPLDAGKVNPTNPAVEGQPYTSTEKVINPNKDDATFTATPTNGLTVGTDGKVTGKPTGIEWTGDETEKTVNIPVTVSRTGDTPVTVTIPVVVQRDLDGDGTPDVSDDDIDGDGIPNDQDPAPRVKDGLTSGKVTPTNKAVDGQPYTSKEKVINPNKPGTTVTPTPTNGLTIDGTSGKVTGTPTGLTWNGDDTEQTVNIPVVISKGNETVNVTIPVVVQRDLDGDGTPDVSDDDIDGDGIPNDQDPAPRVKDGLTSGKVTPTNKAVDGQPYTSKEKVINPNKPGTTVTPTPTNGLTIDGTSGKVTGTPTGLTWNGDDTEQTVNIPVTVSRTGDTPVTVTIPVVVQRDVTKTPTFTVGNQDPTDGHVDVTVSGVPDGTKVTLPGVNGEKVVTGGKVTLTNDELPETPQTGKGRAQEDGKLPKEGTSDITIPGKISSSKGEPEVQTETPDYTNTIPVTPVKPATNDNGAKSNDSQNVLPNTGTESNATLASLGLLGLLSGFGLVARKKKED
ncbi:thrombospondin type 3 repeat-containing protein, partial [Streptococcus mitis]|uniref:thrombospondin type 3 repeat-containing protein n=2 Tax=Streptococcus mitis TaxID=28037 RepID=UPI0039C35AF9